MAGSGWDPWTGDRVSTRVNRVLGHVGTRRPRVQVERAAADVPGVRSTATRLPCGSWPSCTTRPRSTSRRSSRSRRRASSRSGPGSSSGSGSRPPAVSENVEPARRAGLHRAARRPQPAPDREGPGPRDHRRSPPPAGRAPARRRHRPRVGEGPRARPTRWEHAISADVEEKLVAAARRPGDVPARQPDPGLPQPGRHQGARRPRRTPSRAPSSSPHQREGGARQGRARAPGDRPTSSRAGRGRRRSTGRRRRGHDLHRCPHGARTTRPADVGDRRRCRVRVRSR